MTVFADAAQSHDAVQENIREIDEDPKETNFHGSERSAVHSQRILHRQIRRAGVSLPGSRSEIGSDTSATAPTKRTRFKKSSDNPNLLLALEYQTLSFENAAVKVIHLKATTQYKDNVVKKKNERERHLRSRPHSTKACSGTSTTRR